MPIESWPSGFYRGAGLVAVAAAALYVAPAARAVDLDKEIAFEISPQPLVNALIEFSKQADVQVMTSATRIDVRQAPGVNGQYPIGRALQMLLDGSGLSYSSTGPNTIAVTALDPEAAPRSGLDQGSGNRFRLAQADTAAGAESARSGLLEEIIVTATKREERLIDVPISISAYDTAAMDRRGVRDLFDIAAMTPGLNVESDGFSDNIAIRGIAAESTRGSSTTAIYIDDTPLQTRKGTGTLSVAMPRVFDLERVEVLRGPQGTLFGGGSLGGAVRFITPQPSLTDYSAYARAELSQTRSGDISHEAGIAVGGPISEGKLGFRLSGWHRRDGGYVDHVSFIPGGVQEEDSNYADSYIVRAAIAVAPTEHVTITPSVFFQDVKTHDASLYYRSVSDPDSNDLVTTDLILEPTRDKFYLPALKVEAELGFANLTSISSYLHRESSLIGDFTRLVPLVLGRPVPTSVDQMQNAITGSDQQNYVQEIRLTNTDPADRLQWTVGAFYLRSKVDGVQANESPVSAFPTGLIDGKYSILSSNKFEDEELAGFVNTELELRKGVSLLAGVRVSELDHSFDNNTSGPLAGLSANKGSQGETAVTPRFGINYQPNSDHLFYASVAKGFRAGGGNVPVTTRNVPACARALAAYGDPESYDSDSLWSHEIGAKSALLDGRLRVDASVFYVEWKGIQQRIQIPACNSGPILNLGEAVSKGFDLAASATVSEQISGDLAVGYTSTKYSEGAGLAGVTYTRKGELVADNPPWSITAALQYDFNLTSMKPAYVRVENRYGSRNDDEFPFQNPQNQTFSRAFVVDDATNQLNVRLGVNWDRVEISAFANNLLDAHPRIEAESPARSSEVANMTLRPLTFGVTTIVRW